MTDPEKTHRFVTTGKDREGRNRTVIAWRETGMEDQRVMRQVVLSLDATTATEAVLTCGQAAELAEALREAAATPAPIPEQRQ
jgi:hypothetical protein